ncbi:MAG: type I DNA topoisomerase [Candidatus Berkelbacteria bacterium]|nr:type I DNA topoisomerase [Candidatus Berkelbacteria bacterium]
MHLVIVESPAKGKTIEKYLGTGYRVVASFGHVRDLPTKKIGIDAKNNFEPTYEIPLKAKKTVSNLKKEMAGADIIYLATDYDREGEAIAWHLVEAIKPKKDIKRITFTEITKEAIQNAVKNPRDIDMDLVDAQQARRILDRLVGYKLSPFLWRKVAQGLSAGRVQSVAVRLIVEKEEEIRKFKAVEYWSVEALLSKDKKEFKALLSEKDGKKITKLEITSEKEAKEVLDNLEKAKYIISDLKIETKKRYPSPPFTTSSLQMEAGNKLGFSAKQTMKLAQDIYEDGLITYMRTDSLNISSQAASAAQVVIKSKFGENYALSAPRFYKTKSKGAQEAHEAIRPTDLNTTSEGVSNSDRHAKLYNLIWKRMIASQMKEAEIDETIVKISANQYGFTASGLKVKFDGFLKVYNGIQKDIELPNLAKGDAVNLEKLDKIQHFTEPPARFTEGSLIKELEKKGIGRPSTYAPTISTIQDRGYVEKKEGKLFPKDIGEAVNKILVEHFKDIVDYDFTAKMEENLDNIAEGKIKWQPIIKDFYEPFSKNLAAKMETVSKNDLKEETDEKCPKCGKNLFIKIGRFGKFYACGGFPDCKFTRPLGKDIAAEKTDEKCPKCGKNMVMKESRYGKFLACEGYPTCKTTKNIVVESKVACPDCGGKIVQKRTKKGRTFWGCANYPKCNKAYWQEPK